MCLISNYLYALYQTITNRLGYNFKHECVIINSIVTYKVKSFSPLQFTLIIQIKCISHKKLYRMKFYLYKIKFYLDKLLGNKLEL